MVRRLLHLVTMEDFVLLAVGAIRALQAANEQNCDAHSCKDGKNIRIRHKPVNHALHKLVAHTSDPDPAAVPASSRAEGVLSAGIPAP